MRILVVGTGYVGLVAAACFAEMGHEVLCLDIDHEKIAGLKRGEIPIYEPGLEEIVLRNTQAQRLRFTTDYQEGAQFAEIAFIAVATPSLASGEADLSCVKSCITSLAECMQRPLTIVNKSTVPIGTTDRIYALVQSVLAVRGCEIEFDVAFNPEFLKEGDAIADFMKPDRIVIGTRREETALLLKELYAPFNLNHDRLIVMDPASAEMTKYAANAMLASRISFMNELSLIAERMNADISLVRKGIGSDQRIGYDFLYAGVGFGGSCFPKDLRALRALARNENIATPLLDAIEAANDRQKQVMGEKITAYFADKGGVAGKRIAIWGVAFKAGTDDMREASSLVLIRKLLEQGAYLSLYDPAAMKRAKQLLRSSPQIEYAENEYSAAKGAHAIVLMTEWKQFRFVDFAKILPEMQHPVFFDGRNQYGKEEMAKWGFDYISMGRPAIIDSVGNCAFGDRQSSRA